MEENVCDYVSLHYNSGTLLMMFTTKLKMSVYCSNGTKKNAIQCNFRTLSKPVDCTYIYFLSCNSRGLSIRKHQPENKAQTDYTSDCLALDMCFINGKSKFPLVLLQ